MIAREFFSIGSQSVELHRFRPTKLSPLYDSDFLANELVVVDRQALKRALGSKSLTLKGRDDPQNLTIRTVSVSRTGVPTFTLSAEQDVYEEPDVFLARVRFIAQFEPDESGNLKRESGFRFQVWLGQEGWGDQIGGRGFSFGRFPIDLSDLDWPANAIVDFESEALRDALDLDEEPLGRGVDDPENIVIRSIDVGPAGRRTLTVSAEQDAYDYTGSELKARVRFFSQVRPRSDGVLERLEGHSSFQVLETGQTWGVVIPL